MNSNEWQKTVNELRDGLIDEIIILVNKVGGEYSLHTKTYVHYVEGEVATTEYCTSLSVKDGKLNIGYKHELGDEEDISNGSCYDMDSLVAILRSLECDLREDIHERITDVMKEGEDYKISVVVGIKAGFISEQPTSALLEKVSLDKNGFLSYHINNQGRYFDFFADAIEIPSLLDVANKCEKAIIPPYNIKVVAMYSRDIQVKANNEKDAEEKVKAILKEQPLTEDDRDYIQFQM